jgi:hypothetical protein
MVPLLPTWFRRSRRPVLPDAAVLAEGATRNVLANLPGRRPGDFDSVWSELASLDGQGLLAFDRGYRDQGWYDPNDGPWLDRAARLTVPADTNACRFVASCSPNGYTRQDAVRALSTSNARLAIAAAMIRSKDWVSQVRQEAVSNLLGGLPSAPPETIVGLFDLFLLLGQRRREARGVWEDAFDLALRQPAGRAARWVATTHHAPWVRRAAFDLVLEADPDRRDEALQRAAADASCSLAIWALERARVEGDAPVLEALLEASARHRHPAVRALSLRLRHRLRPAAEPLRAALLDRARGVRDAAAYLLRTEMDESAMPIWRQAFDAGPGDPRFLIAASALAEHAEASDINRLESLLAHDSPGLRSRAVNALSRLKAGSLATHLLVMLRDGSLRVVREVVRAYRNGDAVLQPQDLVAALQAAPSPGVRRALLGGVRALDKWDTLELLLQQAEASGPTGLADLEPHFEIWLHQANARFVPLPDARREALLAFIDRVGAQSSRGPWRRRRWQYFTRVRVSRGSHIVAPGFLRRRCMSVPHLIPNSRVQAGNAP